MFDHALFEALASLSAWEIRAVRRWLQSPAFTVRAEPLLLFDFCVTCFSDKREPDFPQLSSLLKTSDDKKIRREMSELLDLVRDFFAWQEMQKDPARREFYQLRAASRRGLEKNFALALREAERAKNATNEAELERQLLDFQLLLEKYHWDLSHRRGQDFPFENLSNSLNAWFAGQLLQIACMEKAQGAVQRQARKVEGDWVGSVLENLPERPHETVASVALFHLGHEMLARPDDVEAVVAFRDLLEKNSQNLPAEALRGLLMLAINNGIRRINEGDKLAVRSTLDFYLLGLESKALQDERGVLSKYTYNNVLMTFLALAEWERARDFLEKYRPQLPAAERENVFGYNLAIYHFRLSTRRVRCCARIAPRRVVPRPDVQPRKPQNAAQNLL